MSTILFTPSYKHLTNELVLGENDYEFNEGKEIV